MKIKCKVCGEKFEHLQMLEHAAIKHKDKEAVVVLAEIQRVTDEKNKSYGEVRDELGVRWQVIGRDMLNKVMIRQDLKMIHIWLEGSGMIEVEATKISGRFGVQPIIEEP